MLQIISLELLEIYQRYIGAALPCLCRFSPSCSQYCQQAILKYGFFKGVLKGMKRLLSCHPFSGKFGDDPLE